jgi:DNA-binding IclR family transcriptional regulator
LDDREFHDEMRCVAVPVFEKGGVVLAGISLSGPSSRFTLKKLDKLRLDAAEVSRELSRKLGGLD